MTIILMCLRCEEAFEAGEQLEAAVERGQYMAEGSTASSLSRVWAAELCCPHCGSRGPWLRQQPGTGEPA